MECSVCCFKEKQQLLSPTHDLVLVPQTNSVLAVLPAETEDQRDSTELSAFVVGEV